MATRDYKTAWEIYQEELAAEAAAKEAAAAQAYLSQDDPGLAPHMPDRPPCCVWNCVKPAVWTMPCGHSLCMGHKPSGTHRCRICQARHFMSMADRARKQQENARALFYALLEYE